MSYHRISGDSLKLLRIRGEGEVALAKSKVFYFVAHGLFMGVFLLLCSCSTVNMSQPKTMSYHLQPELSRATYLGEKVRRWSELHQGRSAFYPLENGKDALGVRMHLADLAEKTIDVQSFLMKSDEASFALINSFLRAADRGVRVRFLLDDIFTTTTDDDLLLLNQHPNIEVRLYNPLSRKGSKSLNFVGDFSNANRRMHNKSFTVDNAITIVGGRNIANEYFQIRQDTFFTDFDVLVGGATAEDVSTLFDLFWNHFKSVPIDQVLKNPPKRTLEEERQLVQTALDENSTRLYQEAKNSQLLNDLISGDAKYIAATAQVMADKPPAQDGSDLSEPMALTKQFVELINAAESQIILISPYLIPGKAGVDLVKQKVEQGVEVIIITNSLASNNHVAAQTGYARYRKDLLRAGVSLYELRASAGYLLVDTKENPKSLTLHTKAAFIDGRYTFAGSLNLDPRSIQINTEMGLLIDSGELTKALITTDDAVFNQVLYQVKLTDNNKLEWHCVIDDTPVVYQHDPETSWWLRFKAWVLHLAPESQL